MSTHLYRATDEGGQPRYFRVIVELQGDHHRATCAPADAAGVELPGAEAVAPAFYGVTHDQALRRMVQVLENTYEEVEAVERCA
jgi:hypothetical protein